MFIVLAEHSCQMLVISQSLHVIIWKVCNVKFAVQKVDIFLHCIDINWRQFDFELIFYNQWCQCFDGAKRNFFLLLFSNGETWCSVTSITIASILLVTLVTPFFCRTTTCCYVIIYNSVLRVLEERKKSLRRYHFRTLERLS